MIDFFGECMTAVVTMPAAASLLSFVSDAAQLHRSWARESNDAKALDATDDLDTIISGHALRLLRRDWGA